MAKFTVTALAYASKYLGVYEAETEDEAVEMAWEDAEMSLCWQCADIDLSDIYKLEAHEDDQ